jgi:L-cysteine S-thiosulfotransferase
MKREGRLLKHALSLFLSLLSVAFAADVDDMQRDDAMNPAFLSVKAGEKLFKENCISCHENIVGIAAKHVNLASKIKHFMPLSEQQTLDLETYIALQSRGLPFETVLKSEKGEAFFKLKQGQLNLSCANCHNDNAGAKLGDAVIPKGYTNAYPQYRLEWQATGNLTRRLKNCLFGMRATYPPEEIYTELEIYLRSRGEGLKWEAPGVRP